MKRKRSNIFELASDLSTLLPQKEAQHDEQAEKFSPTADDKSVQVKQTINRHVMRRITSELALEKELPWHFEQGVSYHVISFGDVDALTFLRVIVKQQKIRYALVSSWVLFVEDVNEIRSWIERGYIGRCDFYVGEIFKSSRQAAYAALEKLCKDLGGRVATFRNHSKVTVVFGEKFDAVIESSANVNGSPRTEQTCITVSSELAEWYKKFFDSIISFERNFDDVQPWQPES